MSPKKERARLSDQETRWDNALSLFVEIQPAFLFHHFL